jgi:hypothetical protein
MGSANCHSWAGKSAKELKKIKDIILILMTAFDVNDRIFTDLPMLKRCIASHLTLCSRALLSGTWIASFLASMSHLYPELP